MSEIDKAPEITRMMDGDFIVALCWSKGEYWALVQRSGMHFKIRASDMPKVEL